MKRGILRQLWELRAVWIYYGCALLLGIALFAAKIAGAAAIVKWIWQ